MFIKIKNIIHSKLLFILYATFLVSVIFCFRAISSVSIVSILLIGILFNDTSTFFNKELYSLFLIGCFLIFITNCLGLIYTNNIAEGIKHIEQTSALVIVPIAVYSTRAFINFKIRVKLMQLYSFAIFIATIYCLTINLYQYVSNHHLNLFFYHDLVKPLGQHAIQFSILVFIELIFLFSGLLNKVYIINRIITYSFICYLTIILILLSSKLVLIFYCIYLIYYFINNLRLGNLKWQSLIFSILLLVALILVIFYTKNPISKRFTEISSGDISIIKKDKFEQNNYFNGLQFRILQWKNVFEILNSSHKWIYGLSPGDAQSFLDRKYVTSNMYIGIPGGTERGFLGYDAHNQFLESLLQTGIIGVLFFILTYVSIILMIVKRKNQEFTFISLLILAYCFQDSILETQYGLILFTFFPYFNYLSVNKNQQIKH